MRPTSKSAVWVKAVVCFVVLALGICPLERASRAAEPLIAAECIRVPDELIHPRSPPLEAATAADTHTHFRGILPPKEIAKIFSSGDNAPDGRAFVTRAGARGEEAFVFRRILEEALNVPNPPKASKTSLGDSDKKRPNQKILERILAIYKDTVGKEATLTDVQNPEFWKALDGKTLDALSDRLLTGVAHSSGKGLRFDESYEVRNFLLDDMRWRSSKGDESHDEFVVATFQYLADKGIRHVEVSQAIGLFGAPYNNRRGERKGTIMQFAAPNEKVDDYYLAGIVNNFLLSPTLDGKPLEQLQRALGDGKIGERVLGVDIMGGEGRKLTDTSKARLKELVTILSAAKQRDKYVLRVHAGEGLKGSFPPPAEVGRANVAKMIEFAKEMKEQGVDLASGKVILRIAHLTHASPEQIAELQKLGIHMEMLVGSNKVTGQIPVIPEAAKIDGKTPHEMAAHPVLTAFAMKSKIMIGADGDGVMGTTVRGEYELLRDLVESYRDGNFKIAVIEDDKVVYKSYAELSDGMRANIDNSLENIGLTTRDYIHSVTGRPPPLPAWKPPVALSKKVPNLSSKPKPKN